MGRLEGDANYGEILRKAGITVPFTGDYGDGDSMDDGDSDDDGGSSEENTDSEDVEVGIPVQGNAIGDVDPKLQPPMATYGDLRQPMERSMERPMAKPTDGATADLRQPMERPMADLRTPTDKEPKVALKSELPPAALKLKPKALPLVVEEEPSKQEGIVESPTKKRLIEELKKLQTHDPSIVPMEGGGYGKIVTNQRGEFVKIQPVSAPAGISNPMIEQLVAQTTLEDLNINTLGLLRRVALNPTVTMGYTYVTNTVDPKTGYLLFKGDLADWINWCVDLTLKNAFGVKFGIFTGAPSLKDASQRKLNN